MDIDRRGYRPDQPDPDAPSSVGNRVARCGRCLRLFWYFAPYRVYPRPDNCMACRHLVSGEANRMSGRRQRAPRDLGPPIACRVCGGSFVRRAPRTMAKACDACLAVKCEPRFANPVIVMCSTPGCGTSYQQPALRRGGQPKQFCDACLVLRRRRNRQTYKARQAQGLPSRRRRPSRARPGASKAVPASVDSKTEIRPRASAPRLPRVDHDWLAQMKRATSRAQVGGLTQVPTTGGLVSWLCQRCGVNRSDATGACACGSMMATSIIEYEAVVGGRIVRVKRYGSIPAGR